MFTSEFTSDFDVMKAARAYLVGLQRREEIVPGAADAILRDLAALPGHVRRGSAAGMLRVAIEHVHGTEHPRTKEHAPGPGAPYLDHRRADDKTPPLRLVVDRLAAGGFIKKDSADDLWREHAADSATSTIGQVAERLATQLQDRPNWQHMINPPEPTKNETIVLRVVRTYGHLLTPEARSDSQVGEMARLAGGASDEAVAREVANLLLARTYLQKEPGTLEFDFTDPMFAEKPATKAEVELQAKLGPRSGGGF